MSTLKDEKIQQGTRKRTEYENTQRARLAINVTLKTGGMLSLPIAVDMRSHVEEARYQHNTLLAILPMCRLPGYSAYNEAPRGAVARPGRIYVFQNGKLWREVVCDGEGGLEDIDVAAWRRKAGKGGQADDRTPVGTPQTVLLTPILIQGRSVAHQYRMAYSEKPWSWEYITWLEADSKRAEARSQPVQPAWAAAVVGAEQWRATQSMPAIVVDAQSEGLRPRDFSLETLLDDPSVFTPGMTALNANEPAALQQRYMSELGGFTGVAAEPLPTIEPGRDILNEKSLRGYPQLVGLLLDDPLFAVRHAMAQIRLAEAHLLTLNALIPHRPHGRYAHTLYSAAIQPPSSPLASFVQHLHVDRLKEAVLYEERREAREHLGKHLARLIDIAGRNLPRIFQDWLHTRDERLLEPYALLGELFEVLKWPAQSDALSLFTDRDLQQSVQGFSKALLEGRHPLIQPLFSDTGQGADVSQRLQALADQGRAPDPAWLGLSSLLRALDLDPQDTDRALAYKNLHALIGDFVETFTVSTLTLVSRLKEAGVVFEVPFYRLFGDVLALGSRFSSNLRGLELLTEEGAEARGLKLLGINSGELRNGLLPAERQAQGRKNYLYANIRDAEGRVVASTSPRHAPKGATNLGRGTLLAAPDDHHLVKQYSAWRHSVAHWSDKSTFAQAGLPVVAVICAMYNLKVQIVDMKSLKLESADGSSRYKAGVVSALIDATVAIGMLSKPVFGAENSLVDLINKPRVKVSIISKKWADNLERQTRSPKLPILRGASGFAMFFSSALSVWDAKRAWHQGDRDAALAYGVAAAGGAAWGAYAFGLCINPMVLVAGAVLFIGGTIVAGWLTDSDIEALFKNGPFGKQQGEVGLLDKVLGDDQRFSHLANPDHAYQQLLGVLGKPVIRISRLGDWLRQLPPAAQKRILRLERRPGYRGGAFEAEDWAVTLHSPLLSMFDARKFQLYATEELSVLPFSGVFNVARVERQPINTAKLSAQPLDDSTVLYILPRQRSLITQTPLQRHAQRVTQGLRVQGQFHLLQGTAELEELVLPQPSPKTWRPYQPGFAKPPAAPNEEAPYWQIEVAEFKA
ncbi:hypothetical protein [Metapseudomonas otitidis]|uniref:hypothetical protein n=1 Tax=Metapseudomonas otitidis TaxID=319939 RepID=UPI0013F66216|nr:hypothetical protein [Pseudomonas otitidis]